MESRSEEIRRLQGCINDLVSLLALPAMWRGRGPPQVVDTLLDALSSMLRLDFAYARLNLSAGGSPVEAVRIAHCPESIPRPEEVGRALELWLNQPAPISVFVAPNPLGEGEVSLAYSWLGLDYQSGVVVVGSQRADFPTDIESLLLRVAVNQAVIELQTAQVRADASGRRKANIDGVSSMRRTSTCVRSWTPSSSGATSSAKVRRCSRSLSWSSKWRRRTLALSFKGRRGQERS